MNCPTKFLNGILKRIKIDYRGKNMTDELRNPGLANAVLEAMVEPLSKGKGAFYLGLAELGGVKPVDTIAQYSSVEVNTEHHVAFAFNRGTVYGVGFDFNGGESFREGYHTAVEEMGRKVFSREEDLIARVQDNYGIIVARSNPLLR